MSTPASPPPKSHDVPTMVHWPSSARKSTIPTLPSPSLITDRTFDSLWSALEARGGRSGGGGGDVKDAQEHGIGLGAVRQRARAINQPRNRPPSAHPEQCSHTNGAGPHRGVCELSCVDQSADQTSSSGPRSWTNSRSLTYGSSRNPGGGTGSGTSEQVQAVT